MAKPLPTHYDPRTDPDWVKDCGQTIELMSADAALHELDERGIPYRVRDAQFEYNDAKLAVTPGMRYSLKIHKTKLVDIVQNRIPRLCAWCRKPYNEAGKHVVLFIQIEGRRYTYCEECYQERRKKVPGLVEPEVLYDCDGYSVIAEDSGLCAFCCVSPAVYPPGAPNICERRMETGSCAPS